MCAARRPAAANAPEPRVQRLGPFGPMPLRRAHLLRPEQIHPVVRIAHRHRGGLVIPERIIFDHELVWIAAGQGHWTIAGATQPFGPHDLLFVPPFVPHSLTGTSDEVEHVAVHFDFREGFPAEGRGIERRQPYRVRFTHGLTIARQRRLFAGHKIERALTAILAHHAQGEGLAAAQASLQLTDILLALLGEPRKPRTDPEGSRRNQARVDAVVRHMMAHLGSPLDHDDLTRVAGLSASRLQALFGEITGYPPLDYLRRLRVEEARRLLADPRWSVKEIAARTGFRDTSHFSKVFRRIDGLSPAHYRDALLAGRQEK